MYQYADFGSLPRYSDAYMPSPIKKSENILKLQQKWGNPSDGDKSPSRRFSSYREIEKPPFEPLQSPVRAVMSIRSLDSPKSVVARSFSNSSTESLQKPRFEEAKAKPSVVIPKTKEQDEPASDGDSAQAATLPTTISSKGEESTPIVSVPVKSKKATTRKYTRWEFGKTKKFERPPSTPQTNKAAITIQRIARGGMQRLHYKVARLEWLLVGGVKEKTKADVAKIHKEFDQRKAKYRTKMEEEAKKESKMLKKARTTAEEAHKLIAYLRKQNKELREKNEVMYANITEMKGNNARLEAANDEIERNMKLLNEHLKGIEETHAKLMEVVPKYEDNIKQLTEAIGVRNTYGATEHKIKVHYVKLLGGIVERLEESLTEEELAEEVVQTILELEEQELAQGRFPHTDKQ